MSEEIIQEDKPTVEPSLVGGESPTPPPLQSEKMVVIYFLDDGTIHEVGYGFDSFNAYYGDRATQFAKIFGGLVVEPSDYLFNYYQSFKVDISDPHKPELILTEQAFRLLDIFNRTKNLY